MRILAIETSCDETGVAIVEDGRRIRSNIVASQLVHQDTGGIVPEVAAREHLRALDVLTEKALRDAGRQLSEIDAVAATVGPGLIGCLLVGANYARGLALDEAHITTFAVLPERRRRKIGERMLVRIFDMATELKAEWLTLEVRASNLPAQKLYEKYGFRRAGVRRRYYSDNNEDALIMWTERLRDRVVRDRLNKLKAQLESDQ